MTKTIAKRVLPVLLVFVLMLGIMPIPAQASGQPEITIEDTGGSQPPASDPGITVEPNPGTAPDDSSTVQPPDSSGDEAPDSSLPQDSGQPSEAEPQADDADPEAGTGGTLDGASVILESAGANARSFGALSTGTLTIHRFEQYQWDFTKGSGAPDMRPWYVMTIDGALAYCVEPTNPDTHSGGYTTIDYNALSSNQKYAIGYAMLYGAQDMSDPLFHMATQVIIWEIVYGYMELESFTAVNNGAYNCSIGYNSSAAGYYAQITAAMRSHVQIPSFTHHFRASAPLHNVLGVPGEYKLTLYNNNPNCTLADFNFIGGGGVSFETEGEMLHVTATNPLGGEVFEAFKGAFGQTESLIFWGSGADQIRATSGVLDPVPAYFRLDTESIGTYSITIEKLQDGTNIPLSGAQFHVRHTEKGEVGVFTTDGSGKVVVTVPWRGTYICTEIVPPDNHLLDENAEKTVVVSTDNPHAALTYHNKPFSGLEIQKLDALTLEPIAGVVFRVSWEGGFRSQTVTTNAAGIARLADLEPGFFEIEEISCPPTHHISENNKQTIEIRAGEVAKAIFLNVPKPGLAIIKTDSVTNLPMEDVTFEVEKISGERIGTYTSDSGGYIFVPVVDEQYVVIREIATLPGYKIDTTDKLVTLEMGKLNKVYFTNSPYPYLVIVKLDEGTREPLPDTLFTLYYADGREVGTYKTNQQGRIVLTGPGIEGGQKYILKETQPAPGYAPDEREWEIELFWGKTTTVTFKNTPLEIEVEVEKRGPVEAVAGQEIRYDFRNLANLSSVPLDDFYWSDILPTDAVCLTEIYTGTWNENLTYKVMYRTNLKDNWTALAEDLITSVNHRLVCSAQVLGLVSSEYVTEFRFEFGTVKPGFREVKAPFIMCRVLADLPDEYTFTNRTEVGGRYGGKWTYDRDAWTTVVYKNEQPRTLPKTGVWV